MFFTCLPKSNIDLPISSTVGISLPKNLATLLKPSIILLICLITHPIASLMTLPTCSNILTAISRIPKKLFLNAKNNSPTAATTQPTGPSMTVIAVPIIPIPATIAGTRLINNNKGPPIRPTAVATARAIAPNLIKLGLRVCSRFTISLSPVTKGNRTGINALPMVSFKSPISLLSC